MGSYNTEKNGINISLCIVHYNCRNNCDTVTVKMISQASHRDHNNIIQANITKGVAALV